MKSHLGWIVGGIAIILLSLVLIGDWEGGGILINVMRGRIDDYGLPAKWPVLAGLLCIRWGVYQRLKNSN